ncbi:MAG: hypothetical protein ABEI97_02110 [Candidatus Nanohaloarchaea archaeon]
MTESWTDKTVSMDNIEKEEFDGELAHVTVSENGITVEFKDVEDWKRIQREVGDDTILRQVRWEAVEDVDAETEHLYYPHIDVETGEGERRIYFLEDETGLLDACVNAINRFQNAFLEAGAGSGTGYSYTDGPEPGDDRVETDDEVEIAVDEPEDTSEESDGEAESGEEDDDDEESLREEAMEIVEEFMED